MRLTAGLWRHSHEEDAGDTIVFRPEGFAFPRSRGRVAFRLETGGASVRYPIGADDRAGLAPGTWRLDDGRLEISDAGGVHVWEVVAASEDKLVLKRR